MAHVDVLMFFGKKFSLRKQKVKKNQLLIYAIEFEFSVKLQHCVGHGSDALRLDSKWVPHVLHSVNVNIA